MDENRLHELVNQLAETIKQEFPEYTDATITVCSDEFKNIAISKWSTNEKIPINKRPRRELFSQASFNGEWRKECSHDRNETLKRLGVLLGGKDERVAG